MIEQDIIIVKEPTYPVASYSTAPWTTSVSHRWPDIKSQHDLDVWWTTSQFQKGDIVTYSRAPIGMYFDPGIIYLIEEVCTNFTNLRSNTYAPYNPLLVLLKPIVLLKGNQVRAMEWRDVHWLRKCTEHELEQQIWPYLDMDKNKPPAND